MQAAASGCGRVHCCACTASPGTGSELFEDTQGQTSKWRENDVTATRVRRSETQKINISKYANKDFWVVRHHKINCIESYAIRVGGIRYRLVQSEFIQPALGSNPDGIPPAATRERDPGSRDTRAHGHADAPSLLYRIGYHKNQHNIPHSLPQLNRKVARCTPTGTVTPSHPHTHAIPLVASKHGPKVRHRVEGERAGEEAAGALGIVLSYDSRHLVICVSSGSPPRSRTTTTRLVVSACPLDHPPGVAPPRPDWSSTLRSQGPGPS